MLSVTLTAFHSNLIYLPRQFKFVAVTVIFISIVTVNTIIIIIIIIGNTVCRSVQLPSYRLEDQRIKSHLFVVFVSYRHQI